MPWTLCGKCLGCSTPGRACRCVLQPEFLREKSEQWLRRRKTASGEETPARLESRERAEGRDPQTQPWDSQRTARALFSRQIAPGRRRRRLEDAAACAACCAHRWPRGARCLARSSTENPLERAGQNLRSRNLQLLEQSNRAGPTWRGDVADGGEWRCAPGE